MDPLPADVPRPYVVPAARALAAVHRPDPGRRGTDQVAVAGTPGDAYPRGAILGWTACGVPMLVEDLWVRTEYDPDRDGPGLLCAPCEGQARPEEPTLFNLTSP